MHRIRIKMQVDEDHVETFTIEAHEYEDACTVRDILKREFTQMVDALQSTIRIKEKLDIDISAVN